MKNSMHLPPEWAPQRAVLLAWPHAATDWAYMLDDVQRCFCDIVAQICRRAQAVVVAPDPDEAKQIIEGLIGDNVRVAYIALPTNDTWARDFGPISVTDVSGRIHALDYRFNGWGLKFPSDKDNLITMRMLSRVGTDCDVSYEMCQQIVLEGGSIDVDDKGVLLTTAQCLLSPNRNPWLDRKGIEEKLMADLGVSRVVWLEHGALAGDDTDSHVDTLARFLPGDIVACSSCDRIDDDHYQCLSAMVGEVRALLPDRRVIQLPIPMPIYDADGLRLPATYANFLILNGTILMPTYNDDYYDNLALTRIADALPEYEVVGIDCSALIEQHGSLHCMTMQLPFAIAQQ